jgi:hypothetical protein
MGAFIEKFREITEETVADGPEIILRLRKVTVNKVEFRAGVGGYPFGEVAI